MPAEKTSFKDFKARFNKELFDEYLVTIDLVDIAGGIPADPEMIAGWINSKNKELNEESKKRLAEATKADLPEVSADEESKAWTRFKCDENGPYIEGRCLKSALKENGNILKDVVKSTKKKGGKDNKDGKGIAALKKKIAELVFVVEDKIYIQRDGKNIVEKIPTEERPVHAMTRLGPISALKRTDVLRDVSITFTVRLAKTGAISEEALFAAIAYIQHNGVGTDRSQGRGRAKDIDVVRIEND